MHKLIMVTALFLLAGCQSDKPEKATPTANRAPAAPTALPEPVFTQEGVLELYHSANTQKKLLRVNIEIAHDPEERNQGLMWRKKMGENEGMLFVFDFPDMQSFWMHNTYIPLDILYINEKFEVVTILKNVPVLNDTPRPSGKPAQYVLELNAGTADKFQISPGTKVAWSDYITGQSMGDTAVSAY